MKTKFNVFLWVDGKGFEYFKNVDSKELEKRNIKIGDNVTIGYNGVTIYNGAKIGNYATIRDNTTPKTININGSKHSISYWGEDRIDIGCEQRTIEFWYKYGKKLIKNNMNGKLKILANNECYDLDTVKEYFEYVKFIRKIHNKTVVNR